MKLIYDILEKRFQNSQTGNDIINFIMRALSQGYCIKADDNHIVIFKNKFKLRIYDYEPEVVVPFYGYFPLQNGNDDIVAIKLNEFDFSEWKTKKDSVEYKEITITSTNIQIKL